MGSKRLEKAIDEYCVTARNYIDYARHDENIAAVHMMITALMTGAMRLAHCIGELEEDGKTADKISSGHFFGVAMEDVKAGETGRVAPKDDI